MNFVIHNEYKNNIAEFITDKVIINNVQDTLDLIANISAQDINKIIIHEKNITPNFFNLSNGLAGEILQKCFNYGIKMAIIGDFKKYKSQNLKAFIYESNKGKQFFFIDDVEKAKDMLNNS